MHVKTSTSSNGHLPLFFHSSKKREKRDDEMTVCKEEPPHRFGSPAESFLTFGRFPKGVLLLSAVVEKGARVVSTLPAKVRPSYVAAAALHSLSLPLFIHRGT